jgi:hypothetical protein
MVDSTHAFAAVKLLFWLLVSVLASACRDRAPASDENTHSTVRSSASALDAMSVSETGIGPLRIGMTVAEARASVPGFAAPADSESCGYGTATGLPDSLLIMIEHGFVARVDVDTSTVATVDAARVGDTIPRLMSIYRGRVTTSPNHYTGEPDLIVRGANPTDTLHEIIFETLHGRVVRYRAGQRPQVRYIEGCA